MNILVTGINGYLGKNFLKYTKLDNNNYYGLIRNKEQKKTLKKINKNFFFITGNLDNYKSIEEIINKKKISVIIHLAWSGATNKHKNHTKQNRNILQILNLISVSNKYNIKKIIAIGSQAEYGIKNKKITERMICNPITLYGKTKLLCFNLLRQKLKKTNLVWFRLFSSFGPYDFDGWFLNYVIKSFKQNKTLKLSNCKQKWDFIDSKSVISAIHLAIKNNFNGLYNIGSGQTLVLSKIVHELKKHLSSESKIIFGAIKTDKNDIKHLEADISKIKNKGFYPPNRILKTIKTYAKAGR